VFSVNFPHILTSDDIIRDITGKILKYQGT